MKIEITKTTAPKAKPDSSTLGFGKIFTDHMFVLVQSADMGWHDAIIVPFGNLSLHPASTVLHYGSEFFEGLKSYGRKVGKEYTTLYSPIIPLNTAFCQQFFYKVVQLPKNFQKY